MQQQHLMQMQPMTAYYLNNVTTEHIQQYLDENKSLIIKITESQNAGKLSECAEYQARLQRNLMYLAAIADSQPQPTAMNAQFPSSGSIVQNGGGHYMQHQQAQQMSPQVLNAARSSMLYSQQQYLSTQQQQALQNQVGMSSSGSSGLHMLQNEANSSGGSGGLGGGSFVDFAPGGSGCKHDLVSAEGRGGSSGCDGGETLYLKSAEEGN